MNSSWQHDALLIESIMRRVKLCFHLSYLVQHGCIIFFRSAKKTICKSLIAKKKKFNGKTHAYMYIQDILFFLIFNFLVFLLKANIFHFNLLMYSLELKAHFTIQNFY